MTDLPTTIAADREVLSSLLERARAIPAGRWTTPRAPGKWSPAQVVEHVTLSYEGHRKMVQGGIPQSGNPRITQWLARTFFLPRLFRMGDFTQKGLKAPRFIVPSDTPALASELLPRLEAAATGLEQDLTAASAAGQAKVVHPFFGPLALPDLLQFVVIHARHHLPQVIPSPP